MTLTEYAVKCMAVPARGCVVDLTCNAAILRPLADGAVMGTWGHRIMDHDFAGQVRDDYLERLYSGLETEPATDDLCDAYWHLDTDEHPVFWLALAHTQLEFGRLTPRAKTEALKVIQSGEDLARWEGDKKRQRVLVALEKKLTGPQKPEKKLPKRPPTLRQGDVFRFRLSNARNPRSIL